MWGTCLGFEELSYLISGKSLLTLTHTDGITMPLNFTKGENSLFDLLKNVTWAGGVSSKYPSQKRSQCLLICRLFTQADDVNDVLSCEDGLGVLSLVTHCLQ